MDPPRRHLDNSRSARSAAAGASGAALIDAASNGQADAVYRLLVGGAPVNARDPRSGGTALHVAASFGWLDVVDVLIGWGPLDLEARDDRGRSALAACVEAAPTAGDAGGEPLLVARVLLSVGLRPDRDMIERASPEFAAVLSEWLDRNAAEPRLEPELGELAWAADVALLAHVSRSPLADVRPVGAGFAVASALERNDRNGMVCSVLPGDTADAEIADALGWLADRRAPGQWMIGPEPQPSDLGARLERAGCRAERSAVFMAARLAEGTSDAPRDVAVERITRARDLTAAHAARGALDDDPHESARELELLASLGLGADAPLRHFAARRGGHTVGYASAFVADATLMLVELGVSPAARRRGIAAALVRHALADGRAAGCTVAIVAPTRATLLFYERLGFAQHRFPPNRTFYTPA